MTVSRHLNLAPPLVHSGRVDELIQQGQTLSASLSPSSNSLAVFVTSTVRPLIRKVSVCIHLTCPHLRRLEFRKQIIRKSCQCILLVSMLRHRRIGVWYVNPFLLTYSSYISISVCQ